MRCQASRLTRSSELTLPELIARTIAASDEPPPFPKPTSELASEGAVLEGGEEDIEFSEMIRGS